MEEEHIFFHFWLEVRGDVQFCTSVFVLYVGPASLHGSKIHLFCAATVKIEAAWFLELERGPVTVILQQLHPATVKMSSTFSMRLILHYCLIYAGLHRTGNKSAISFIETTRMQICVKKAVT